MWENYWTALSRECASACSDLLPRAERIVITGFLARLLFRPFLAFKFKGSLRWGKYPVRKNRLIREIRLKRQSARSQWSGGTQVTKKSLFQSAARSKMHFKICNHFAIS